MAARRASAISLLTAILFSLTAPFAFAGPESNLPACCRRAGAHHCGMASADSGPLPGPAARTARCADFPGAKALPGAPTVTAPAMASSAVAIPVAHLFLDAQTKSAPQLRTNAAHPKRGPPQA